MCIFNNLLFRTRESNLYWLNFAYQADDSGVRFLSKKLAIKNLTIYNNNYGMKFSL